MIGASGLLPILPGHKTCRFPEGTRRAVRACARDVWAESVQRRHPLFVFRLVNRPGPVTPNRRRGKHDQQSIT